MAAGLVPKELGRGAAYVHRLYTIFKDGVNADLVALRDVLNKGRADLVDVRTKNALQITLMNELKTDLVALTADVADIRTKYAAALTLVNELKTDYTALLADVADIRSAHNATDTAVNTGSSQASAATATAIAASDMAALAAATVTGIAAADAGALAAATATADVPAILTTIET